MSQGRIYGLTLVEMLLAVVLSSFLMFILCSVLIKAKKNYLILDGLSEEIENEQMITVLFRRFIHHSPIIYSNYNPSTQSDELMIDTDLYSFKIFIRDDALFFKENNQKSQEIVKNIKQMKVTYDYQNTKKIGVSILIKFKNNKLWFQYYALS